MSVLLHRSRLVLAGALVLCFCRPFKVSLPASFPTDIIGPEIGRPTKKSSSQVQDTASYDAVSIEIQPPRLQKIQYGNQTAFELLQAHNNCTAQLPDRLLCGKHCDNVPPNETKLIAWCDDVCSRNSCKHYMCLLGNPPPMLPFMELHVSPPPSPNGRLIPRIIHQTWTEPLTKEKYPNWFDFQATLRQQEGYEYRFYTDEEARDTLQAHFPPEVVGAYDDILPGAFKADLFRYCVLLIYGGLYADIDVALTAPLDDWIPDDVGFVVPLDKPQGFVRDGNNQEVQLCLWNGFLAASPGHPYLAKVVENIVNAVRNRYNHVDYAHIVTCPSQLKDKEILRSAPLFGTGPCMLGVTVNQVLGRHEQSPLEVGVFSLPSVVPGMTVLLDFDENEVSFLFACILV
jgi:Glycosyltransferase sugar-binding region containing DXD motif